MTTIYSEEIDFRGLKFSSTLDQIIQQEGNPDEVIMKSEKAEVKMFGDTWISYDKKNVAGYESEMQIELLNGGILSGTYSIVTAQKELLPGVFDPKEYSNIYNDLLRKLSNKYGEPLKSNNIEDFESPISGLYARNVINMAPYKAIWEKDNGAIILMLQYNNSWSLLLIYMNNNIYNQLFSKNNDTEGL